MANGIKMLGYWFFQTSVLNVRSMAIHSHVEGILHFSGILDCTFSTLDHIDHIGRLAVGQSFDMVYLPSYWTLKCIDHSNMSIHFMCLMALRVTGLLGHNTDPIWATPFFVLGIIRPSASGILNQTPLYICKGENKKGTSLTTSKGHLPALLCTG